jgi:hypothetical protein
MYGGQPGIGNALALAVLKDGFSGSACKRNSAHISGKKKRLSPRNTKNQAT